MIYAVVLVSCLMLFAVIHLFGKNKKPLKRAFINMFMGVVALISVNIIGLFCNVSLPVSPFSFMVSACGGVPGVAAMVLINTMM